MKLLLLLICFTTAAQARVYWMREGKHGNSYFMPQFKSDQSREVTFNQSAIYKTQDPQNQGDINKLFGFADCFSHHHKNSARFGWRWFDDQLQIHAYYYVKGQRRYQFLKSLTLDTAYEMRIHATNDRYIFQINQEKWEFERGCSGQVIGYKLYPYFGGDEVAPQDINVKLNRL